MIGPVTKPDADPPDFMQFEILFVGLIVVVVEFTENRYEFVKVKRDDKVKRGNKALLSSEWGHLEKSGLGEL